MMKFLGIKVYIFLLFVSFVFPLHGEQIMKFKAIEIRGKVQKPQVTYILPRSRLLKIGIDINDLKPNLLNNVWENLETDKDEHFR